MPENNPQNRLYEYMENIFKDEFNMMYTSQPATIVSFNADENTLTCTLDKEGITLKDIPITLFGNPTSYITTPTMEKGTKGILIFSKHDLYSWVEDGTDKNAKTDFSKNNAFFLIGATNKKNKIIYNMDAIEIKTDKKIELISEKDTSITSQKMINIKSTLSTNINAKNITATAIDDISLNSKSILITGSTNIILTAPSVTITATATGEELISLCKDVSTELKGLSTVLSQSRDQTYNQLLTNSNEIATYINKFDSLANKFGGFSS